MINLDKIELQQFQKHKHLIVDFCDGVNVLYGSSDSGKSCIRRAIEFLCGFNAISGIRKTGTKQTSVKGWFSNGVILIRIRSASINRYILQKDGKEQVFDAIGKTPPQEIQDAIGIYPFEIGGTKLYLNSQPQIGLPFLFDLSPTDRAKIFNKLTGNDVLDKLFGQFNVDILRIKRGHREETERFEERAKDLKQKQIEKEKAEAVYGRLKKRILNVRFLYEKYSKLLEIKELEEINKSSFQETKLKLNNLKFPQATDIKQLKEKIDRYEQVKSVKNSSERADVGLGKVRGQLKAIRVPDFDSATCMGKMNRLYTLENINADLGSNKSYLKEIKIEMKEIEVSLTKKEIEYKNLLKEAKILCPNCKHDITEDCLRR